MAGIASQGTSIACQTGQLYCAASVDIRTLYALFCQGVLRTEAF
jgi:hypothetical protein